MLVGSMVAFAALGGGLAECGFECLSYTTWAERESSREVVGSKLERSGKRERGAVFGCQFRLLRFFCPPLYAKLDCELRRL